MLSDISHSFFYPLNDTFFIKLGQHFTTASLRKTTSYPFKDHPQLSAIIDILSRKNCHHIALHAHYSPTLCRAFIEALLYHLCQDNIPHLLQQTELLYIELSRAVKLPQQTLLVDIARLQEALDQHQKCILLFLNQTELLDAAPELKEGLLQLSLHPKCRLLAHSTLEGSAIVSDHFSPLRLENPNHSDILSLLKQQRLELEQYHHVVIPEELLSQAYDMAQRYLHMNQACDQALLLLDSAAARAATHDKPEPHSQSKPIVTSSMLIQVLSNRTQIPTSHLQPHKFKYADFIQGMQQRVYGQDDALASLGHDVQEAYARLHEMNGPFLSFLFAGPKHAGKMTTAIALSEQLFKKNHLLFIGQPTLSSAGGLAEMRVQRYADKQYLPLNQVMHQTPYAVIVLESIEHASLVMLDGLYEILATGHLQDSHGNQVNFRQATIVVCTTLGSNRIANHRKHEETDEGSFDSMNLMDLVMHDGKSNRSAKHQAHSTEELIQEMLPEITSYLPAALCQHLHVIPFLSLSKSALDHILRLKLKKLGRELENRHGIELSYAPEVIRFLIHDTQAKSIATNQSANIEAALKQLYSCIEQAILSQSDQKIRSQQLFLQLNETGQTLRYHWLTLTNLREHTA